MSLITLDEFGLAPILDTETAERLARYENAVKAIKEQEELLKQKILEEMEMYGFVKIETPILTINYIASTDRETFDSKSFRKEHPDLYDDFVRMTPVKPSIRIKVK